MRKIKLTIFSLVMMVIVAGCAGTQQQQAGKAMLAVQETIVQVAVSADHLCTSGVLNQSQCTQISLAYEKAKVHYDLAETALAVAIQSDTEGAWAHYQAVHSNFQAMYNDLLRLAINYGIQTTGGE